MDLTSGSRMNVRLRETFQVGILIVCANFHKINSAFVRQLPTLAVAANPLDKTALLVPDAFMVMGVFYNSDLQGLIPPQWRSTAKRKPLFCQFDSWQDAHKLVTLQNTFRGISWLHASIISHGRKKHLKLCSAAPVIPL